jgi:hypothetical protein
LPNLSDDAAIPPSIPPPALGTPRPSGLACISCGYDQIVVDNKVSGPVEVDLDVQVGADGTVSAVSVAKTPTEALGAKLAEEARSWIFEPPVKDGKSVRANTTVRLHVRAVKELFAAPPSDQRLCSAVASC